MKHIYLIAQEQKPAIEAMIEAVQVILCGGGAEFTDLTLITTTDDRLAAMLDQVMDKDLLLSLADGLKPAPKRRPSPQPEQLPASEAGEVSAVAPVVNRSKRSALCRRCKRSYTMIRSEKLCPDCTAADQATPRSGRPATVASSKGPRVWTIVASGERINHLDLQNRMNEHQLAPGDMLDKAGEGAYRVASANGNGTLKLERILE